jgi:hypothetical protein
LMPSFRQRSSARLNHFSQADAGCGHDRVRRDVRDDDAPRCPLRVQGCLIPAVVPLTFANQHDAQTGKCNKESELKEPALYFFTNSASDAVKPCR